MTFKECFTKIMKERGQTDKQITIALMEIDITMPHDDKQITPDEEKAMTAFADILMQISPLDLKAAQERHLQRNRRMN